MIEKVKPIILTNPDTGEQYTLEYNRDTVKKAENAGFSVALFSEGKLVNGFSKLFHYAFLAHHPNITLEETDRILFEELGGMDPKLQERLSESFAQTYNALIRTKESEKNSKWRVSL